jgi:hypothetical protein
MRTAIELYPDYAQKEHRSFYGPGDYQPILNSFGEIVVQVDDNDYQGDSRVLYRNGSKFGWLQFGWGSCSGCDALQACSSMGDIQNLIDELNSQIKWFDSASACLDFFNSHDWEGDYSWHRKEQRKFIEEAKIQLTRIL